MSWFRTIDHEGREVEIAGIPDMDAVVAGYNRRLRDIGTLLESPDRETRRRGVEQYHALERRRERIEADVAKANLRAELEAEDRYHRDLAQAIRAGAQT